MLSPRWRKVRRDLWLHKSRTLLVVLAISVGIIGAGSVLDTWALLRKATREEFGASNPASVVLRTDSIDAALVALVRAIPAVKDAEARRTLTGKVFTETGWSTALLISSADFRGSRIGIIQPDSGAWPPPDSALVVESSSVDFSGAEVGRRFTVQVGDAQPRELAISGIARDVGLAPGWMEHVVYLFVTPPTLATLGAPASFNQLQITVRDPTMSRAEIRSVAATVGAVVASTGRRVHDVEVPVPGRHIHAAQIDSLLFTQGAFGLLALLLSGFLVVNLVSAMLTGQIREIGIMKSLGAGSSQIATMYLGLALAMGAIACAVAIPAAMVIGRLYAEFTANLLNFDIAGATIPGWAIAAQLGVGLVLPLVASAIPVVRGCSISVSDALRDLGIGGGADGSQGAMLRRATGISRPLLLSLRNAFRRRQRMMLTLITLSTGGAVYIGALNLRAAVVASVDTLFGTQRFDFVIRFVKAQNADSVESIVRAVDGVRAAEAWSGGRAAIPGEDGTVGTSFPITAPPARTTMMTVPIVRGRWLRPGDTTAMVVNTQLALDDPRMELGNRPLLAMSGTKSRWEIVGVAAAGPSPAAYATREALSPIVSEGRSGGIVVASGLTSPDSQLELIAGLRSALTGAGIDVQSSSLLVEQRRVIEDHLLMVVGFLGMMSQLIIIVGGLGLASTMSLAVLERTREIGVLRAIGARHRAILGIIQAEGLVIAVLSWLIAIPLSIPMSIVLGKAFGRTMFEVPVTLTPDLTGTLSWLAVVTGVSIVACAWPAFRAMRVPTAAALAYE